MHPPPRDLAPPFAAAWSPAQRRVVRLSVEAVCVYYDVTLGAMRGRTMAQAGEARRWLVYLLTHDLGIEVADVCALLGRRRPSIRSMLRTRAARDATERRYIGAMLRRLFAWQNRLAPEMTEDFNWYHDPAFGTSHAAAWRRDMEAFLTAPRHLVAVQERLAPPRLRTYMPA